MQITIDLRICSLESIDVLNKNTNFVYLLSSIGYALDKVFYWVGN